MGTNQEMWVWGEIGGLGGFCRGDTGGNRGENRGITQTPAISSYL